MFKVSAVPPRRSAMLTVFRGATAINDGTTAEPLRPWRCNYGLCRTSTAVAPRLQCDGGRRSAVMTILRDATAINDGTTPIMAVSEIRNQKSEILYLAHWPTIISAYKYTYNVNGPWAGRLPKDCNISRYHGSHPTERK